MSEKRVSRRFIARSLMTLIGVFVATPGNAAGLPFDGAQFEAAQAAGKTILVEVHAPWCPTCARQRPIVESLMRSSQFRDVVLFHIDFDTGGDALRRFNVQSQGTLIVFKGREERGRAVFETNANRIRDLIARGL